MGSHIIQPAIDRAATRHCQHCHRQRKAQHTTILLNLKSPDVQMTNKEPTVSSFMFYVISHATEYNLLRGGNCRGIKVQLCHIVWYKQVKQGGYLAKKVCIMHISGIDQSKICPAYLTRGLSQHRYHPEFRDVAMIRQMELLLILHSRQMADGEGQTTMRTVCGAEVEGAQGKLTLYCQMIQSRSPQGHRPKLTYHSHFTSTRGNPLQPVKMDIDHINDDTKNFIWSLQLYHLTG